MEQCDGPTGIKEFNNFRVVLHTKDDHPTWPVCDSYELQLIDIGHSDKVYVVESDELQAELDDLRSKLKEAESQIGLLNVALQTHDKLIVSLNETIKHTNDELEPRWEYQPVVILPKEI